MKYTLYFIEKLRRGDQKAYEKLYQDLYAPLVLFVKKYLQDQAQSEDIVQETFINLWENASKVSIHTSLKAYLYTSVRNAALTYLEKEVAEEKRKREHQFIENSIEEQELILTQDVCAHIHQAIKSLPEKSREVIFMSMNELSMAEIQEELDVSRNTVKTNKRRAYQQLRRKIKNIFFFFSPLF